MQVETKEKEREKSEVMSSSKAGPSMSAAQLSGVCCNRCGATNACEDSWFVVKYKKIISTMLQRHTT